MELKEWIELALTILGSGFAGGMILVKFYYSQQTKIEELKNQRTEDAILRLESAIHDLQEAKENYETSAKLIESKLSEGVMNMSIMQEKFKSNKENVDKLIESMKDYTRDVDKRIRNVEHAMDAGELIKIGNNKYMFKSLRREKD